MTKERRQSNRRCTSDNFLVINSETRELLGRVLNISPDGLLLAGEKTIDLGSTVPCRLNFPYWHGLHQFVTFEATSQWCKKNIHLDWYESGWSIGKLSDTDREIVLELISEWKTKDGFGVFRVNVPDSE